MMKRIFLMGLTILLLCVLSAGAEDNLYSTIQDAMYRIVLRTEAGDETLGSGVLFLKENLLLTAEGCFREGELYAIGADGEHRIAACETIRESGAVLMELAEASSAAPLGLANYDRQSLPCVFGVDAEGNMGVVPLYQILYAVYREQTALMLSAEEGLLPGGIVVDDGGSVVALVVAQQMEGVGMYMALEPETIYNALTGGNDTSAYLPLEITWSDGLLSVAWTDGTRGGGIYIVYICAEENSYYTLYNMGHEDRSLQLAVPPGYTYYVQVEWAESEAEASGLNWNAMTAYTVPKLYFRDYGFRQECYLALAPAGVDVTDALEKTEVVTEAVLMDAANAPYLQVFNTYDVSGRIEEPMCVVLTAPDGQLYFEEMMYAFDPEYEEADVFAVPLSEIFRNCRDFSGGRLMEGEYTLCYTIGGLVAGECTFVLEGGK